MNNKLVEKGLSTGDVVKTIASIIDGSGGGRAKIDQAGGKNPAKIVEALKRAFEIIAYKLQA
ncbi:DHHA1 domain-containing protein [Planctomycetota bacterium]